MKQILKLILLLVIGQTALAQAPSNYVNINGRYRWIAGMFDSTFHIPKGTTPSLRTGGSTNGGALFYKTADSSLQLYTGTQWLRMLKVGDTTGMLTPYFNSVGVGLKNTGQTVYADTLLLSTRLWRNKGIDSVQANLTAGLATKLNISDTASMLSPYARTVNVRQIVSDSLGGLVRLKALNAGGAALYANSGTKVAEWGLGGSANMDFHGFAGYDINRASSYTVRSFTDKNYVDSAISASPSGTVTSVATNTGTGITGGTITTSGTIAADTLLLSTRAWRQKGVDSVASLINTRLSGTTNYIPKFTSSSAIGNSQIFDNGTNVIVGGTSGLFKFQVNDASLATLGLNSSGEALDQKNWAFQYGTGVGAGTFRLRAINDAGTDGQNAYIITRSGTTVETHQWLTSGSERMRLDASGNLGIGTSSPSTKLDVSYTAAAGDIIHIAGANNVNGYIGAHALNNGGLYINSNQANQDLRFRTQGTDRAIIDASGNLGLGVTPSAWSAYTVMQITNGGALFAYPNPYEQIGLINNGYFNGSNWIYTNSTSAATRYLQYNGEHIFYTAPGGTAGGTISFTQAMTLDASGRLGIGTTSPSTILQANFSSATAYSSGATGNGLTLYNTNTTNNQYVGLILQGEPTAGNAGQATIYGITTGSGAMDMAFSTRGSSVLAERMRITSGGELLINTTSDAGDYKLQVNGNGYFSQQLTANTTAGSTSAIFANTGAQNSNGIELRGGTAGTSVNWKIEKDNITANGLEFTPSTTNGGTTYTTPSLTITSGGAIKTAAPSGGTAAAWKLGERVASAGVTFNDQQYIQLDIGGTLYYLATVDLPMPEAYPQATSGPSNNYKIAPVQVKTTRDAEIEKLRKEIEELKQLIKNK